MKPKTLLTFTTVIMILHGIGILLGAESAAKMGIENIHPDALNMGQGAYEIAGFFNLFLAAVLVSARTLDTAALRSLSKGIAVGWVFMTAGVVYHIFSLIEGQAPPAPMAVIFGLIALWALYVAFGTQDEAAAA